jgi:DNA repair exonuclease SbcCD ATPase subunit
MNNYTNVDLEDQPALTFFATMGILYLAVFVALEKTLEAAGMKDMFVTGGGKYDDEKSNKRLIALALLFFAVFVGSGAFTPVIVILSQSIVATIIAGVIAVLLYTLVAGGGVLKGGLYGARGTGRAAKAKGRNKYASETEELADAIEKTEEAEEILQSTKKEEQDAENRAEGGDTNHADQEARDVESKLRQALEDIETAEDEIQDIENTTEQELQDLRKSVDQIKQFNDKSAAGPERDFEERVKRIRLALTGILQALNTGASDLADLLDGSGNGSSVTNMEDVVTGNFSSISSYDLDNLENDIKSLFDDLDTFATGLKKENAELHDHLEELFEIYESHQKVTSLLENLSPEIKQAMEAENFEDELAQQFGDEELHESVGLHENEIRQLGETLESIEEEHQKIDEEIRKVSQLLDEQLELEGSELDDLEEMLEPNQELEKIEDSKNQILNSIGGVVDPDGSNAESRFANILANELDINRLEELIQNVLSQQRGQSGSMRQKLNDLIS